MSEIGQIFDFKTMSAFFPCATHSPICSNLVLIRPSIPVLFSFWYFLLMHSHLCIDVFSELRGQAELVHIMYILLSILSAYHWIAAPVQ